MVRECVHKETGVKYAGNVTSISRLHSVNVCVVYMTCLDSCNGREQTKFPIMVFK